MTSKLQVTPKECQDHINLSSIYLGFSFIRSTQVKKNTKIIFLLIRCDIKKKILRLMLIGDTFFCSPERQSAFISFSFFCWCELEYSSICESKWSEVLQPPSSSQAQGLIADVFNIYVLFLILRYIINFCGPISIRNVLFPLQNSG